MLDLRGSITAVERPSTCSISSARLSMERVSPTRWGLH